MMVLSSGNQVPDSAIAIEAENPPLITLVTAVSNTFRETKNARDASGGRAGRRADLVPSSTAGTIIV
jgi:hypothetical protein